MADFGGCLPVDGHQTCARGALAAGAPMARGTIARCSDRARSPLRYLHGPPRLPRKTHLTHVEIHTDGACKGNPGPGGWGVRLQSGQHVQELFGGELSTTNNRMEMTAVIEGLLALKRPCQVTLYLDSEYVRKGITEWIHGWKARGWKTAAKQPVKNADLWQTSAWTKPLGDEMAGPSRQRPAPMPHGCQRLGLSQCPSKFGEIACTLLHC